MYVDEHHIEKALCEKVNRSNYIAEKYREMIHNGTILVETDGFRIGQINCLAVMGTRDSIFGIPTKITAQTFVGKSGIMNIEREAALSGQIHHKGMMILTGFYLVSLLKTVQFHYLRVLLLNKRIHQLMGIVHRVPNFMCCYHPLQMYPFIKE